MVSISISNIVHEKFADGKCPTKLRISWLFKNVLTIVSILKKILSQYELKAKVKHIITFFLTLRWDIYIFMCSHKYRMNQSVVFCLHYFISVGLIVSFKILLCLIYFFVLLFINLSVHLYSLEGDFYVYCVNESIRSDFGGNGIRYVPWNSCS